MNTLDLSELERARKRCADMLNHIDALINLQRDGASGKRRDVQGAIKASLPSLKAGDRLSYPQITEALRQNGYGDIAADQRDPVRSWLVRSRKGSRPLLRLAKKRVGTKPGEYELLRGL